MCRSRILIFFALFSFAQITLANDEVSQLVPGEIEQNLEISPAQTKLWGRITQGAGIAVAAGGALGMLGSIPLSIFFPPAGLGLGGISLAVFVNGMVLEETGRNACKITFQSTR